MAHLLFAAALHAVPESPVGIDDWEAPRRIRASLAGQRVQAQPPIGEHAGPGLEPPPTLGGPYPFCQAPRIIDGLVPPLAFGTAPMTWPSFSTFWFEECGYPLALLGPQMSSLSRGCPAGARCPALSGRAVGDCSPERFAQLAREDGRSSALEMCTGEGDSAGRARALPTRLSGTLGSIVGRGSLSRAALRRVVRVHMNEVRFCFEMGLHAWPDLAGRVRVHFVVGARGQVLSSAVEDSGLADETTARVCRARSSDGHSRLRRTAA